MAFSGTVAGGGTCTRISGMLCSFAAATSLRQLAEEKYLTEPSRISTAAELSTHASMSSTDFRSSTSRNTYKWPMRAGV